jgi:hypothetical protein
MNCKALKIFAIVSLALGLAACNEDTGSSECKNVCKDDNTLTKCNEDGTTTDETCANGCDKETNACKAETSECKDVCKDDNILTKCNADGTTTDETCANGCDKETNACKAETSECKDVCKDDNILTKCNADGTTTDETCANGCADGKCKEAPKCTADVCKDARTLLKCNADGTVTEEKCRYSDESGNEEFAEICTFGKCETGSLPTTCSKEERKCLGDAIVYDCVNNGIEEYPDYELQINICSEGRTCKEGLCIAEEGKQGVNYCKDLKTLAECANGVCTDKACAAGELCIHDTCVKTDIKACESDTDCGSNEKCHDKVCYRKADLEKAVGDACSMNDFQEYCKDGKEYKCGYDSTVEVNDCAEYNGCSLILDLAYPDYKKGVRDAACRGETEMLKQCTAGGVTALFCTEGIKNELSVRHACTLGTDGQYVYSWNRDEITCEATCNVETGLCN